MSAEISNNSSICPTGELSALLDGELSSLAETRIEEHLAVCGDCRSQLNEHKRLLSALNFAFDEDAGALPPAGFSKLIITRAESGVTGLRCRNERRTALRILVTVTLIGVLFSLYPLLNNSTALLNLWDGLFVLLNFTAVFIKDFGLGAAVIVKNLSQQFSLDSRIVGALIMCAIVLTLIATLKRLVFVNVKRG
jgi:hypothetical protein